MTQFFVFFEKNNKLNESNDSYKAIDKCILFLIIIINFIKFINSLFKTKFHIKILKIRQF